MGLLYSGYACLHNTRTKSSQLNILALIKERLVKAPPNWGVIDSWWSLCEGKAVLFVDMGPGSSTVLQWMGQDPWVCEQYKLDFMGSKNIEKE